MKQVVAGCMVLIAAGLAGCGKEPTVSLTNASVEEVANSQAAAVKMKPGKWEITVETLDTKVTGAPAGAPPMPKQAKATTETCLTQEQVDKPTAVLGGPMQQFKDSCTYDKFAMTGGKLDAAMHCNLPGGQKVTGTTTGSFSETEMSTETASNVTGLPNGMGVSNRMKVTGRRVGECDAAAKAAPAG